MSRDTGNLIDAEHPWPGLLPFTESARAFFHGRDAETDELTRLIEREALSVLFGQSGLGKSSLLNAGVFPRLRKAGYLPLFLRLNLDDSGLALIDQVWQLLKDECARHEVAATEPRSGDGFWQYLHRPETRFLNPHGRKVTPVLAIDQFEEIFTLGRQSAESHGRCQTLLRELGELIENRLPPALEAELTEYPERLDDYDLLGQNLKIVFVFREDYLADFEGLKSTIRPIMVNRMRLTPMSGSSAAQATLKTGGELVSREVAERIVRFVGGGGRDGSMPLDQVFVEPALLSLVCRELNDQRLRLGNRVISADLIRSDNTEQIIEQFYLQGFAGVGSEVRHFVEDRLLTAAGYRDSCALDNALAAPGVSEAALQTLVDRRILRREERGGRVRLELIHDVLASVAKTSREQRRSEEALAQAQRQIARQRQRQRWMAVVSAGFLAVLLGVSWLAVTASQARDAAAKQAQIAEARALELQQVSQFQADMLGQVDATAAGKLLSSDVAARLEEALSKAGESEADRAAQAADFANFWAQVNATDAARALIDSTILKPAIDAIDAQFKDQPLVDASLRQVLADRYVGLGLYEAALPLQERALAIRRNALGQEHPDTLTSIDHMGTLLYYQGKPGEVEPYFREVLEKRRRVLGEEHPDTINSINNLGALLQAQGKLGEAEPFAREAVEKNLRRLGGEDLETLNAINNLAFLLQTRGKLDEAERYFRQALETYRRVLGDEHPKTLNSVNNLGLNLQVQGKLDEAEPYAREAMQKRRSVLGEEHPDTLVSISNLGGLLQAQGKLSEAEPFLREAMEKRRRLLGETSPGTLVSIDSMGGLLQAQGKHAQALDLLLPIEAAVRAAFVGGSSYRPARLLTTMGKARTSLRQFPAAEANLLEAQALFVLTPGPKPQDARGCIQAVVDLYRAWDSAEPGKGFAAKAAEWSQKLEAGAVST